jgi:prefoldin subunit 5
MQRDEINEKDLFQRVTALEAQIAALAAEVTQLTQAGATQMAAIDDLNAVVANIVADEAAIGTAIAAVQTALAALPASAPAAAVEAAVAQLATAHTAFGANVSSLNSIAVNP